MAGDVSASEGEMGCGEGVNSGYTVRVPIFTNGSTTPIFIPCVRLRARDWEQSRSSILVENITSANLDLIRGFRGSNDGGLTWTEADIGSTHLTANGWSWGTGYFTNNNYQIVEFGVRVKNIAGTTREFAMMTFVLDLRAI